MKSSRTPRFQVRTLQAICEVAGAAAIAGAGFLIWLPLGLLIVGAALVLVGNMKVGK